MRLFALRGAISVERNDAQDILGATTGLRTLDELPDVARWDPTPEEQSELRERLLRAGEARAGGGPTQE